MIEVLCFYPRDTRKLGKYCDVYNCDTGADKRGFRILKARAGEKLTVICRGRVAFDYMLVGKRKFQHPAIRDHHCLSA